MFVNPGGETGTEAFAFQQGGYTQLTDFLTQEMGYELGRDLFAAPYDWRLTLPTLEESGQFDFIAKRVEAAVHKNCGKKAIIIGHSMGTLVSLGLMQSPDFERWRCETDAAAAAAGGVGSAAAVGYACGGGVSQAAAAAAAAAAAPAPPSAAAAAAVECKHASLIGVADVRLLPPSPVGTSRELQGQAPAAAAAAAAAACNPLIGCSLTP
jgi:pimeloyl-ACP methyl ester carboxylesterase